MFKTSANHGFQLTFENGWTISVQWGKDNYCERRSFSLRDRISDEGSGNVECKDAEIAAWDGDGIWLDISSVDQVKGWLDADEVASWITKVAAFKGNAFQESQQERELELRLEQKEAESETSLVDTA